MAIDIRPKAWGTIPTINASAITGHPLCPKYGFFFGGGAVAGRDIVSGVIAANSGTPGSVAQSPSSSKAMPGTAREHSATTDRTDLGLDSLLLPTGPVTIVIAHQKTDGTNRNSATIGCMAAGVTSCADIYAPFSDGVTYFDWGGQTNGVTRVQVGSLTYGDNIWVMTVGAREMAIYQDGISKVSSAINPTRVTGNAQWELGDRGSGSDVTSDLMKVKFVYVYWYQLTVDAIRHISHHPFCWVAPPR